MGGCARRITATAEKPFSKRFAISEIEYIISSPGSEWGSLWEALVRQKVNSAAGPTYMDVWHETIAVDMAVGYTQITGTPLAVRAACRPRLDAGLGRHPCGAAG